MKNTVILVNRDNGSQETIQCSWVHTLVIGSGAAGLNAAVQLVRNGVEDVLILTEGLTKGTSINTGSDKQTYYKLSMCGTETDSPRTMADSYLTGGSMHGDLALIEASLSARAFLNLVNLGVPFPRDQYGQFVGYKTDHDPRQRATSIGPYTSREMCRKLIEEAQRLDIPIREGQDVIVAEPEKALLDHWHLTEGEWTTDRLEEMRYQHVELIREDRLRSYAERFRSPRLDRAVQRWLELAVEAEKGTVTL